MKLLGLARDRNGCLFQSFAGGQIVFGAAALWAPAAAAFYLAIAAIACLVGWAVIMWIETR